MPVLFYIHPVFSKGKADFFDYSYLNIHQFLKTAVLEDHLLFLDGLDAFRNFRQDDLRCISPPGAWFDPWHPNNRGHEVVAEQIASFLFEKRFL